MAKLLTHHDPYHIHAFFGLLTLIHFVYRIFLLVADVEDSGFGKSLPQDVFCMIIMILPNLTSFLFTIVPVKKGLDGFTIWKEYRWHATIFTFRSWIFIALFLYEKHFQPEGLKYMPIYRVLICFTTMYCAQLATTMYPSQETTIRGMYSGFWSGFAAGFLQFLGTSFELCGSPKDDISVNYLMVIVIQLNAFNMTLRKKRKVGQTAARTFYSILLASSFYLFNIRRFAEDPPTGLFDPRIKIIYLALISYYFRRCLSYSRFFAWAMGLSCIHIVSNTFDIFNE